MYITLVSEEENASSFASIRRENEEITKSCSSRLLRELSNEDNNPSERPIKRRKTIITETATPPTTRLDNFLNRRIPFSGDYVPITFADGRRFYLDMESEDLVKTNPDVLLNGPKNHQRLLPDDLAKLVQTAEQLVSYLITKMGCKNV